MSHPSFLALDRHALVPNPEVTAHLASCAVCRGHVETVQRELPVPQWVQARAPGNRRGFRWQWAPAVVAVAMIAIVLVPRLTESPTQAKGAPAVVVWVKRGEAVTRWAGAALRPGDAVRLELSGAGFPWVAVAGADGRVLFRGAPAMTPAWELDDAAGDERLLVVFSRAELPDAEIPGLARRRDTNVWAVDLALKREAR